MVLSAFAGYDPNHSATAERRAHAGPAVPGPGEQANLQAVRIGVVRELIRPFTKADGDRSRIINQALADLARIALLSIPALAAPAAILHSGRYRGINRPESAFYEPRTHQLPPAPAKDQLGAGRRLGVVFEAVVLSGGPSDREHVIAGERQPIAAKCRYSLCGGDAPRAWRARLPARHASERAPSFRACFDAADPVPRTSTLPVLSRHYIEHSSGSDGRSGKRL
jgi:hypothetical protein